MRKVFAATSVRQYGTTIVPQAASSNVQRVHQLAVNADTAMEISFWTGYTNEIQSMYNDATGGTFTASYAGQGPTSNIAYNANAATLETALETMSNIGNVSVTGEGTISTPWIITFTDPGGIDVDLITTNDANLTGLASTITEATKGVVPVNEIQSMYNDADGGTFTVTFDGTGPTSNIAWNANAATLKTALQTLGNIANVTVTGDGTSGTPWIITFVDPGGADVALLVTDDYLLTKLTTTIGEATKGVAPVNEIQTLYNDATSGTFTLTFGGQETSGLAHDILDADLTTALELLSTIGDVTVSGVGDVGDKWLVTFVDPGGADVAELVADDTLLLGGTGTTTIATSTPGVAAVDEIQSVYNGAAAGTFKLTYSGDTTADIDWDATAAAVESALEAIGSIDDVNVAGIGTVGTPWLVTFVDPGSADLNAMTSTDAFQSSTIAEDTPGVVAVNEIQSVHNTASGGTFKLTYDSQPSANIAYDVSAADLKTALELLSSITTVSVAGTGASVDPWLVTFESPGSADLTIMTSDDALLTGESNTITESTGGAGVALASFHLGVDGVAVLPYSEVGWFDSESNGAVQYSTDTTGQVTVLVGYDTIGG